MILSEIVAQKLKAGLANITAWKGLIGSQFVEHLAIFIGWTVEDGKFKVERARQEAFIDTALNRSSLIAHAEGREYMPRKPKPSHGTICFNNSGTSQVTLRRGREFLSDAGFPYVLDAATVLPPQTKTYAEVTQYGYTTMDHEITEEKPFYEILLDRELTPKVMDIEVFIDLNDGEGYEKWKYSRLFENAYRGSKVYDEFYHVSDQLGIRFGNGSFGAILPVGANVRLNIQYTEGDTMLLQRQYLYPTEEILDDDFYPASLTVEVAETIQNGAAQEGTEEMRRNLHYWPVYNERLIWDNDYTFFLRRKYPEIVFAKAWGEEEAERLWGMNVEHINKIWICAYAPRDGIIQDVMEALRDVPMMCRNFQWYNPEHIEFTIRLTGRVLTDKVLREVEEDVRNALYSAYGKDSTERRDVVRISELYETIYATGHFEKDTGAWFEVVPVGTFEAEKIYQMVSLDLENSQISIDFIK